VVLDNQYPIHLCSISRSRVYDNLLGFLTTASQLRHRVTFSVLIGGTVRLSTARLPGRRPPLCTLTTGDWFDFSNTVTTSAMPPKGQINTQEPSLCEYILMLTLRFALVLLATSCPTQACDAKICMAWGQRGVLSKPENPPRAHGQ
jgi:hypothetical protein